MLYLNTKVG